MIDQELLERLSSDNSELKMIVVDLRGKNKFLYDYNNVLIKQNEELKKENVELRKRPVKIDIPEYVAKLEQVLMQNNLMKSYERMSKNGYVTDKTHKKVCDERDHFIKMYHEEKEKNKQVTF
jgi:hypothetical protein